jgi:murein DD-endopeptidase MepM/ murein hydrolase activator NlpD
VAERRAAGRTAEAHVAEREVSTFAVIPAGRGGFARPVPGGITSPFGMRFHPVLHVWKLHDGTDFGAGCGTPIRAPAPGRVASVSFNAGYGNRLMLDHQIDGRRVRTGYNHAIRYVVRPGTAVERGQLLGYVGSTGYSTGCHLHLMLWVGGRLANPMSMF